VEPALFTPQQQFHGEEVILANWKSVSRIVSAIMLAGVVSACAVASGRESGGDYVDDAGITTKVKTSLAADVGLKPANQIHVETYQNVVQLSGFVDTPAHKAEAESVARGVEGVRDVKNDIIIQP
jgi:osmotically-inducible protein OsmY